MVYPLQRMFFLTLSRPSLPVTTTLRTIPRPILPGQIASFPRDGWGMTLGSPMIRKMFCSHSVWGQETALAKSKHSVTGPWMDVHCSSLLTTYHSLAYCEIRLVLCKLLYHFDVALHSESTNWTDQKCFFLWDKPSLMVTLQDRFPGSGPVKAHTE